MRKTLTSEALKKAQRKYKTSEKGREMARRWRSTPEQRAKTAAQVARLRAARQAQGLTNDGKPRQRERLHGLTEEEKRARKVEQRRAQRQAAKRGSAPSRLINAVNAMHDAHLEKERVLEQVQQDQNLAALDAPLNAVATADLVLQREYALSSSEADREAARRAARYWGVDLPAEQRRAQRAAKKGAK